MCVTLPKSVIMWGTTAARQAPSWRCCHDVGMARSTVTDNVSGRNRPPDSSGSQTDAPPGLHSRVLGLSAADARAREERTLSHARDVVPARDAVRRLS